MIYYIKGTLTEKSEDYVVIEASGLGYCVFVPSIVIDELPAKGNDVTLYTHHHIREDAQTLYGFKTLKDKEVFLTMISISGIGPKVGIKILSAAKTEELIAAILQKDLHVLTSIPGVGKKVAERIIVELSDKLHKLYPIDIPSESGAPSSLALSKEFQDDLIMALKTLGYSLDEIKKSIKKSMDQLKGCTIEQGIKVLLKQL